MSVKLAPGVFAASAGEEVLRGLAVPPEALEEMVNAALKESKGFKEMLELYGMSTKIRFVLRSSRKRRSLLLGSSATRVVL